jgi:hypothetical protein
MHLVKCEPFPVDPRIARTRVFSQSALFEFAIDHVIGMRVLVKARQWRTKTMRIVRYFMGYGRNQHAFWHRAVPEQGIDANERKLIVQRQANQSQALFPGMAVAYLHPVHAWYIREVPLPDAIEICIEIAYRSCVWAMLSG